MRDFNEKKSETIAADKASGARGRFITFEGGEGCGKSTQILRLKIINCRFQARLRTGIFVNTRRVAAMLANYSFRSTNHVIPI